MEKELSCLFSQLTVHVYNKKLRGFTQVLFFGRPGCQQNSKILNPQYLPLSIFDDAKRIRASCNNISQLDNSIPNV